MVNGSFYEAITQPSGFKQRQMDSLACRGCGGGGEWLTEIHDTLLMQIHTLEFMRQAAEVAINRSALLH